MLRAAKLLGVLMLVLTLAACPWGSVSGGGGGGGGAAAFRLTFDRMASLAHNSDEYYKIWGITPSAGQEAQMAKDLATARNLGITLLRPSAKSAREQFLERYSTSTAHVMSLVGHNDGGNLKFPDGTAVGLTELGGPNRPQLAVIACYSSYYVNDLAAGLERDLIPSVAIRTEQILHERLNTAATSGPPSVEIIQQHLNIAFDTAAREKNVRTLTRRTLGTSAGAGGLAGIVISGNRG